MPIILIVVVFQVYICVKTCHIVHFKQYALSYVSYTSIKLFEIKRMKYTVQFKEQFRSEHLCHHFSAAVLFPQPAGTPVFTFAIITSSFFFRVLPPKEASPNRSFLWPILGLYVNGVTQYWFVGVSLLSLTIEIYVCYSIQLYLTVTPV